MSGPPPIVLEFVTKGLDETLKAMKSIKDAVISSSKAEIQAAKAKAKVEKDIAKSAEAESKTRLQNMLTHAQTAHKTRLQEEKAAAQTLSKAQADAWRRAKASLKSMETERVSEIKKRAQKEAALEKAAAKASADQLRILHRERAAEASQQAKKEAAIKRQVEKTEAKKASVEASVNAALHEERRKIGLEIRKGGLRGDNAARLPANHEGNVFNRMQLLRGAEGKTLEQKQEILRKNAHLKDVAKIDLQRIQDVAGKEKANEDKLQRQKEANIRALTVAHEKAVAQWHEKEANAVKTAKKKQEQEAERFHNTVGRGVSNGVRTATSIAGSAVKGALEVGGGFSLTDSLQRDVEMHGTASKIATSSDGNMSSGAILDKAKSVGRMTGTDPREVLTAIDNAKKLTGDTQMAMDMMPDLAKLGTAMGVDMGDMGLMAGNIVAGGKNDTDAELTPEERKKVNKLTAKDVNRTARVLAYQGMVGGVELEDMAKLGGRLVASANLHGGDMLTNEAIAGASAQIARQKGGASNAYEATMATMRFTTDTAKASDRMNKQGVRTLDDKGHLLSQEDLVINMLKAKGSKVDAYKELGLGERGGKVLLGAQNIYNQAGGGEAGLKAVREEYKKYKNVMSDQEVEARFKERMAATDKQLEVAMQDLRNEVATQLLPALRDFIPYLTKAVPYIGRLLDAFVSLAKVLENNPLAGLGAIVGVAVGTELAKAGLASVLEGALGKSLGSLSIPLLAISTAYMTVEALNYEDKKRDQKNRAADTQVDNAMQLLKDPEGLNAQWKVDEAKKAVEAEKSAQAERRNNKGGTKANYMLSLVGGALGDAATLGLLSSTGLGGVKGVMQEHKELGNQEAKANVEYFDKMQKLADAAAKAEASLRKLGEANPAGPTTPNTAAPKPHQGPMGRRDGG